MGQIRLWWFGRSTGSDAARARHKNIIEHQVGTMDIVIRLAFAYTKNVIVKTQKRWEDKEIAAFVYSQIWSKYNQFKTVKKKDGNTFEGPTFWHYAVENKKRYKATVSTRGTKKLKQALRIALKMLGDDDE